MPRSFGVIITGDYRGSKARTQGLQLQDLFNNQDIRLNKLF